MERKGILWSIIFVLSTIIDGGIIIYATVNQFAWLLYLMVVTGLIGAYELSNRWNIDERTDAAINDASRLVIKIFLILIISTGSIFILLSSFTSSVLWEVGAALIGAAIILIYLQLIISVYYEGQMS